MNRTIALLITASLLLVTPAAAGTISLAWDPVADADLAGYQVYWGTSSGNYTSHRVVGSTTSVTLGGLAECTDYYVAVKARDAAGNESAAFSPEIRGYPRPVPFSLQPAVGNSGSRLRLVVHGTNFVEGASLRFGNPAIVVDSLVVLSCTEIEARVTVGAGSALGPTFLEVSNPGQGFGLTDDLFTVLMAEPPTVVSTSPASRSTGVRVTARPVVTFSQPIDPATVDATTVSLLDESGGAVPQAAGSPILSADGRIVVVVPANDLDHRSTYRIRVLGDDPGIRSAAGLRLTATYLDAVGFTTEGDTTGPVLSDVSASPEATSVEISWNTDEPADGQVFYRNAVDATYRQVAGDAGLANRHSIRLEGLAPATAYTFQVRSADAEGNRSASPDGTFTTTPSSHVYVTLEAERGVIEPLVQAVPDGDAFGGGSIQAPLVSPADPSGASSGRAELSFYLPEDGTWYEWFRLSAPLAETGGWLESIDGAPGRIVASTASSGWSWTAGSAYPLLRGLHRLELGGRDGGVRADRILITDDPAFVPAEAPGDDRLPPTPPTELAVAVRELAATLTWRNPAEDVASFVIRYRTDGEFPLSPADGLPVTSGAAIHGAMQSFTHSPLLPAVTYRYAVFAVDGSGNASNPVTAAASTATPPATRAATLFSISDGQFYPGIGTMRHDAVYALVGSQVEVLLDPFLPPNVGLDGFHFLDPTHLVFSVHTSAGVQHAGGFTYLKRNNLYRFDLVTRAITSFYDFQTRGVIGVTAFALLGDGRIAFAPDQTMVVFGPIGTSLTLRPKNLYTVDPATDAIALYLDGDLLGVREIDVLNVLPGGEIVFSTSMDLILRTGAYVRPANAYEWNPATGAFRIVFDGRALGVNSLDGLQVGVQLPPR